MQNNKWISYKQLIQTASLSLKSKYLRPWTWFLPLCNDNHTKISFSPRKLHVMKNKGNKHEKKCESRENSHLITESARRWVTCNHCWVQLSHYGNHEVSTVHSLTWVLLPFSFSACRKTNESFCWFHSHLYFSPSLSSSLYCLPKGKCNNQTDNL